MGEICDSDGVRIVRAAGLSPGAGRSLPSTLLMARGGDEPAPGRPDIIPGAGRRRGFASTCQLPLIFAQMSRWPCSGTLAHISAVQPTCVGTALWSAARLELGAALRVNSSLRLVARVGVAVPFARQEFVLDGEAVHEPAALSARAALGVEFLW